MGLAEIRAKLSRQKKEEEAERKRKDNPDAYSVRDFLLDWEGSSGKKTPTILSGKNKRVKSQIELEISKKGPEKVYAEMMLDYDPTTAAQRVLYNNRHSKMIEEFQKLPKKGE